MNRPAPLLDPALADTLALRRQDRHWSFADFLWVQTGFAIATWAFLFGGTTALFVGFDDGLWTMVLGNSIGVVLMLFASVLPTSKWGAEHFILQRSIYGATGVMLLVVIFAMVISAGWTTILALMFGKAAATVIASLGGPAVASGGRVELGFTLVALGLGWAILARGDAALRRFNRYVAPALIIVCMALIAAIVWQTSWAEIRAASPLTPEATRVSNIMLAIELNIAGGMAWWSSVANIARPARTQRAAMWASFLGLVPISVTAQAVGLTAALVLGSSDPVTWIIPMLGVWAGIALLFVIGFANLTSLAVNTYSNTQTLLQHLGPGVQRLGWNNANAIFIGFCATIALFSGATLYDRFLLFVGWSQALFAAAIGVTLADYFVLRRRHIDLAGLYALGRGGPYRYWRGINPAALLALMLGAGSFIAIFNPATLTRIAQFNLATASIPALLTAFVAHLLLSWAVVIPAGKGGYARSLVRPGAAP